MDHFTKEFRRILEENGWVLLRTMISETPLRAYIIDNIIADQAVRDTNETSETIQSTNQSTNETYSEAAVTKETEPLMLPAVFEKKTKKKEKKTPKELDGKYIIVSLGKNKGKRAIRLSLFPSKKNGSK